MNRLFNFVLGFCLFVVITSSIVSANLVKPSKSIDDITTSTSMADFKLTKKLDFNLENFTSKDVDNSRQVTAAEFLNEVNEDSVISLFKDYVSGYSTLCSDAEQIMMSTEHYVVSDDARTDVSIEQCEVSGDKGHIINCKSNACSEIWYDDKNNYYVNLRNSDDVCSGWTKVGANEVSDEFYIYIKNQLSTLDNFDKLSDILKCVDTDGCRATKLDNGYMLTAKLNMDMLEILQPVYLQDGIIVNTYVHIYIVDNDILMKFYYVYDGACVEQEVYSFKFKSSIMPGFYDFCICYDNGDVDVTDIETVVKFYEDNIRR